MKKFSICLLLLAGLLVFAGAGRAAEIPTINQQGLEKLLQENQGKVVLLNFFATWCPPCRVELPELAATRSEFPAQSVCIIGLSVDEDPAALEPFLEQNKVNYPIYLAERSVTDYYNITSVPHNIFFAKDGQMVISEPGMAEKSLLKKVIDELMAK